MNYLAHLYLAADTDDEEWYGSLLGDWAKGNIPSYWSEGIRRGVTLHRLIDSFTDQHRIIRTTKEIIPPPYRRYSGIILDMLYDHFLASNWSSWSKIPLSDFCQQAYQMLIQYQPQMPDAMLTTSQRMIQQDWLGSYADLSATERAITGISRRLSRPTPLADAVANLAHLLPELGNSFDDFFPEAIHYYHQQRLAFKF